MGRTKRNEIPKGFVILEYPLLDSEEWMSLSPKAVRVYLLLRRKFNGNNSNDLSLTYSEVSRYMSTATFKKALDELKGNKIIAVVRKGGLFFFIFGDLKEE